MKIRIKKRKKNMEDSKFVAKAVILDGNKVLLLKRSNYLEKHKGEWDLPGGHVYVGEELLAGLAREVLEETGLSIGTAREVFKSGKDTFFLVEMKTKKIKLSSEHISSDLFEIKDLSDLESLTTYYRDAIIRCIEYKGN